MGQCNGVYLIIYRGSHLEIFANPSTRSFCVLMIRRKTEVVRAIQNQQTLKNTFLVTKLIPKPYKLGILERKGVRRRKIALNSMVGCKNHELNIVLFTSKWKSLNEKMHFCYGRRHGVTIPIKVFCNVVIFIT